MGLMFMPASTSEKTTGIQASLGRDCRSITEESISNTKWPRTALWGPLSKREIAALDKFLLDEEALDDAMDVCILNGFFVRCNVRPEIDFAFRMDALGVGQKAG